MKRLLFILLIASSCIQAQKQSTNTTQNESHIVSVGLGGSTMSISDQTRKNLEDRLAKKVTRCDQWCSNCSLAVGLGGLVMSGAVGLAGLAMQAYAPDEESAQTADNLTRYVLIGVVPSIIALCAACD